ncbi:MAG: hypothetical protein NTV93_18445 [Verrucomicrobia bacterium]|nr:hypothetical protein [Verrucomicrobiota bacterium]
MSARKPILEFLFLLLLPTASQALILYDANSNANNYNISVPGTPTIDDPTADLWNHVVQIRKPDGTSPDASGVYLGNGFILTANHVTGTRYFIQGTEYAVDTSYNGTGSKRVTNSQGQGLDLKLVKIQSPPALGALQMMNSTQSALSSYSLYIGWGVGKGIPQTTDPANQGWTWGSEAGTANKRWGRNFTLGSNYNEVSNPNTYLETQFNRAVFASPAAYNNDVFSLTLGDSGGGLFEYVDSQWMLAGIGTDVSTLWSSYYDRNAGVIGDQPDSSYFVSMPAHSQDVINAIPEPSVFALSLAAGLGIFQLLIRRKCV